MKRSRYTIESAALLLSAVLFLTGCGRLGTEGSADAAASEAGTAESAETLYVKNEHNYVDTSYPDISEGIPEDATGRLARIREKGVLTVATEPYFAPQEFIDPSKDGDAQYVGADMELARLIAERMGVTLEIVPLEFSDVLPAVQKGTCDLAISGLAYTPERASSYTLSKGYYFSDTPAATCLLIRETDTDVIKETADLSDKDLIVQSGSLQEALLSENVNRYHEFRRVPSMQEVYTALAEGDADAAAVDADTAGLYISQHPDCGLTLLTDVSFPIEEAYTGDRIAAPQNEELLIAFVNTVIDEVTADGSYDRWFAEYAAYAADLGL